MQSEILRLPQNRTMTSYRMTRSIVLIGVLLVLFFPQQSSADTLRIPYVSISGFQAPLYLGERAGLFKRNQLEAQLIYMFAMRPPVATADFVDQTIAGLNQLGATSERIGVDFLNMTAIDGLKAAGIALTDAWPAINKARAVKTPDELALIRWTTKAKERGYDLVRQALRDSDPPEDKLSRIMS